MGWSCGYDRKWKRDIGYGVPAICDQPGCGEEIDRGLSYVCGSNPYGSPNGCGLYFCSSHLAYIEYPEGVEDDAHGEFGYQFCDLCADAIGKGSFIEEELVTPDERQTYLPTPDVQEWIDWKLTDDSWADWRDENPDEVTRMRVAVKESVA